MEIVEMLQWSLNGLLEIVDFSATSRRLESIASCLSNMQKRRTATEFNRKTQWSPTSCQPVVNFNVEVIYQRATTNVGDSSAISFKVTWNAVRHAHMQPITNYSGTGHWL